MNQETKDKLFYKFTEFKARQDRGGWLIGFIKGYVYPPGLFVESATFKILLWNFNIPTWQIIIILLFKYYIMIIANTIIGRWDEKKFGFWKAQNNYGAKKEHIAPFNIEIKETMKAICNKLGIEHKFKELE